MPTQAEHTAEIEQRYAEARQVFRTLPRAEQERRLAAMEEGTIAAEHDPALDPLLPTLFRAMLGDLRSLMTPPASPPTP